MNFYLRLNQKSHHLQMQMMKKVMNNQHPHPQIQDHATHQNIEEEDHAKVQEYIVYITKQINLIHVHEEIKLVNQIEIHQEDHHPKHHHQHILQQ